MDITTQRRDERLDKIFQHYGLKAQAQQLCEECGELIVAVSKLARDISPVNTASLAEEIVDVNIMSRQFIQAMGDFPNRLLSDIAEEKIERQLKRIRIETGAPLETRRIKKPCQTQTESDR